MAEWIVEGEASLDVYGYRAWRFGPPYRDPSYAAEGARESLTSIITACAILLTRTNGGRPRPGWSALLLRVLQDLGCVFGKKNGWERPRLFPSPASPGGRAGADQHEWGWTPAAVL